MNKRILILSIIGIVFSGCQQKHQMNRLVGTISDEDTPYTVITGAPAQLEVSAENFITGRNFGATQGEGVLYLNTTKLTNIISWTDTKITFFMDNEIARPGTLKVITPKGQSIVAVKELKKTVRLYPHNPDTLIHTGIYLSNGDSFIMYISGRVTTAKYGTTDYTGVTGTGSAIYGILGGNGPAAGNNMPPQGLVTSHEKSRVWNYGYPVLDWHEVHDNLELIFGIWLFGSDWIGASGYYEANVYWKETSS